MRRPYDDHALVMYFEDDLLVEYQIRDAVWQDWRGTPMPRCTVETNYGTLIFAFVSKDGQWRIDPHGTYNVVRP